MTTIPLVLATLLLAPNTIELTWLGHSAFLLKSPKGTTVMLDPFPPRSIGYAPIKEQKVDAVAITHEHADHNYLKWVKGKPKILHAVTETRPWTWQKVDQQVADVHIRSVNGTWHSEIPKPDEPAIMGPNGIFVIDVAGLHIVHLGDLAHLLKEETIKEIGPVDVLLIPVGGKWTIAGPQAQKVKNQLNPKYMTIPIHYKTDVLQIPLEYDYNDFIAGRKNVVRSTSNKVVLDLKNLPSEPELVVLDYRDPELKKKAHEAFEHQKSKGGNGAKAPEKAGAKVEPAKKP